MARWGLRAADLELAERQGRDRDSLVRFADLVLEALERRRLRELHRRGVEAVDVWSAVGSRVEPHSAQ
jgi:hypothetical protein